MISIILFAILGAGIDVSPFYWFCYGMYCAVKVIMFVYRLGKK